MKVPSGVQGQNVWRPAMRTKCSKRGSWGTAPEAEQFLLSYSFISTYVLTTRFVLMTGPIYPKMQMAAILATATIQIYLSQPCFVSYCAKKE